MNRGTKITVFIASMALTVGSLFAFVGPRHCGHRGIYGHCDKMNATDHHHESCTNWNDGSKSENTKPN